MELPIRCKVFYGLTKEDEATLFAIQTGNATCLTAGERLRANLVAENPDALYFVGITSNAGVEFAYIDRCNCYHPDGKEEKPAHPCAGGFQPGL